MQSDFKNFDWDGLLKKIPIKKTDAERAERKKIMECYGYEWKWIYIISRI